MTHVQSSRLQFSMFEESGCYILEAKHVLYEFTCLKQVFLQLSLSVYRCSSQPWGHFTLCTSVLHSVDRCKCS